MGTLVYGRKILERCIMNENELIEHFLFLCGAYNLIFIGCRPAYQYEGYTQLLRKKCQGFYKYIDILALFDRSHREDVSVGKAIFFPYKRLGFVGYFFLKNRVTSLVNHVNFSRVDL